jgi:mRNA-degrading endonuclease RelE of RelBE toxin-antitoxin system
MYKLDYTDEAKLDMQRLVYEIHDTEVIVLVLTAYGHYDDK